MILVKKHTLENAKLIFNHLLSTGEIENIIRNFPERLDFCNVHPDGIAKWVEQYKNEFTTEVKWYRTKWPWSPAMATTYTGNFNYIGLNSRKGNRSLASLTGSIAHEWGHCLEYFVKSHPVYSVYFFNHGDNSPVGKENTFQYLLGRRVKRYIEENEDVLLRSIGIRG